LVFGVLVFVLLVAVFGVVLNVPLVKGDSGTIYIRADGTIDPPTAPITTLDNVTYTLTGNITSSGDGIIVERDNITIDGDWYTVQGTGSGIGISLFGRTNVTVRNTAIKVFYYGISLSNSSSNIISGNGIIGQYNGDFGICVGSSSSNIITGNTVRNFSGCPISLDSSFNNTVAGNNVTNNYEGIMLSSCSSSNILGNNITGNSYFATWILSSSNISIHENNITNNGDGIALSNSFNTVITHNNITDNHDSVWGDACGIRLYNSSDNAISENRIVNNDKGTRFEISSYNDFYGNTVTNSSGTSTEGYSVVSDGIHLISCAYTNLFDNYIANNRGDGICIELSGDNNISDNNVTTNDCGIDLWYSSNNRLAGNTMSNNRDNFIIGGSALSHFVHEVDTTNMVDDKPIYYWVAERNMVVPLDAGYVALVNCTGIRVQDLNLKDNGKNLFLAYTTNCTIIRNSVANNRYGIWLVSSFNNTISANNLTDNWNAGIYLDQSYNNTIYENNITNNQAGIWFYYSSSNSILGNNITNNTEYGIRFYYSSSNGIDGNNITTNSYAGISFSYSSSNNVHGNNITASGDGIYLVDSSSNSIDGNNITNNSDGISLYGCSNSNIFGNNITANDYAGILLFYDSSNNSISGNNITANNWHGVRLYSSNYNNIVGNTFTNNGLAVWSSYLNFVENNTVNGKPLVYLEGVSDYSVGDAGQVVLVNCASIVINNLNLSNASVGVELWQTNNARITNNNIANNNFDGIYVYSSFNCTVSANNITNNYDGIDLYNSRSISIFGNNITASSYAGIYIDATWESTISENNISENLNGIYLRSSHIYLRSSDITISGNNITANSNYGIYLDDSWYSTIDGNNITNNQYGIYLYDSPSNGIYINSVHGNNIANNQYGVYLDDSIFNIFCHNNFVNNYVQVSSDGFPNAWESGYPSGGNYWSDYAGVDFNHDQNQNIAGGDGVGDTAYTIDAKNIDHYPLMGSFETFNAFTSNGVSYSVGIVSKSNITNLNFSPDATPHPTLSFDVEGQSGTTGFCRVAMPKGFMWCDNPDEWAITVGGNLTAAVTILEDTDYTYIYFTYTHSTKTVQIQSTHAVPEFPSAIILPLFMAITILTTILTKTKINRQRRSRQQGY